MPRHKLPAKMTQRCERDKCHHGRAAHKGLMNAPCKMKNCKCVNFVARAPSSAETDG